MQKVKLESMDKNKGFFFSTRKSLCLVVTKKVALTIFLHNRLQDHEAILDLFLS